MGLTSTVLFSFLITTLLVFKVEGSYDTCYRSYENYPASSYYLKFNCEELKVENNQDSFTFIPISSIKNNYAVKGQTLNTVICFKGLHVPEIITSEKNSNPVDGDKFTWAVLNYDGTSKVYHTKTSTQCDTIYSPNAFSPYETYCMNLIIHDNFDGTGLGRVSYKLNNLYPNEINCYDVPPGHLSSAKYLGLGTYSDLIPGSVSYFYYNCKKIEVPNPVPQPSASVTVEVSQSQYVRTGIGR